MKKFSTISYILSAAILIFAGAIIVKGQSASFLAPTGAPSATTNAPEPINVSGTTQIKVGALGVNGILQAFSNAIVGGNLGIGTVDTPYQLSVFGNVGLLAGVSGVSKPGPGKELYFESPSASGVTPQSSGWSDCSSSGTPCPPMDGTPGGDINNAYGCTSADGGITYNNDMKLVCSGTDANGKPITQEGSVCLNNPNNKRQYSTTVTCKSGTSKYSIRANDGVLEFVNGANPGVVTLSLSQDGVLTGKNIGWNTDGNNIYNSNSGNVGVNGNIILSNAKSTSANPLPNIYVDNGVKDGYQTPRCASPITDTSNTIQDLQSLPASSFYTSAGIGTTCYDQFVASGGAQKSEMYVVQSRFGSSGYTSVPQLKFNDIGRPAESFSIANLFNASVGNVLNIINGSNKSVFSIDQSGNVKGKQFSTGDLIFNHDGRPVWVMDEDENGLYVKSPITGKKYKIMMEEITDSH